MSLRPISHSQPRTWSSFWPVATHSSSAFMTSSIVTGASTAPTWTRAPPFLPWMYCIPATGAAPYSLRMKARYSNRTCCGSRPWKEDVCQYWRSYLPRFRTSKGLQSLDAHAAACASCGWRTDRGRLRSTGVRASRQPRPSCPSREEVSDEVTGLDDSAITRSRSASGFWVGYPTLSAYLTTSANFGGCRSRQSRTGTSLPVGSR